MSLAGMAKARNAPLILQLVCSERNTAFRAPAFPMAETAVERGSLPTPQKPAITTRVEGNSCPKIPRFFQSETRFSFNNSRNKTNKSSLWNRSK